MMKFITAVLFSLTLGVNSLWAFDLCIPIPDQHKDRVVNAIAIEEGYRDRVQNPMGNGTIPNPESKTHFARRMVIKYLKDNVKKLEVARDAIKARNEAIEKVDSEINIQ